MLMMAALLRLLLLRLLLPVLVLATMLPHEPQW
jgi:hypothetical protein